LHFVFAVINADVYIVKLSRLLQEFVEKHGHGLKAMYSVAGWLKKVPATYQIKLVPGPKLAG